MRGGMENGTAAPDGPCNLHKRLACRDWALSGAKGVEKAFRWG